MQAACLSSPSISFSLECRIKVQVSLEILVSCLKEGAITKFRTVHKRVHIHSPIQKAGGKRVTLTFFLTSIFV